MRWLEEVAHAALSLLTFGQVVEAGQNFGLDFFDLSPERLVSERVVIYKARYGTWVVAYRGIHEAVQTREELLAALGRATRPTG